MARFLITVWPFPSHFFPLLSVAGALRERGHEVAFYSGTKAREAVESEGHRWFGFQQVDDQRVDELLFARDQYASWRGALHVRALFREWLLGTVPGQLADLRPVLAAWKPDAIVCETSMWGPLLVLHETGEVPVAVFSTVAACLLPGPEVAPPGMGLPRPTTFGRKLMAGAVAAATNVLARGLRREVDALRARHGLAPLAVSVTEHTGRLPLYLVPTVPEFDYERRDLPPSVRYVGPCLWSPVTDAVPPAWLRDLPHDRPWVHVTEGTMHTQEPILLRAAARGLGGRDLHVVMTTGGRRDPAGLGLGALAANVHVENWLSHRYLFPRTDVVVTTGGAGTVMTALEAGVPLVVVPTEWDKPENAQRVVEAGVGLRIAPCRLTPARLRRAVERVLSDPSFRAQAQRLAAALGRRRGPARAAELLAQLVSGRPVPAETGRVLYAEERVS